MYIKAHQTEKGNIIAACDDALIGKVLREGKKVLDLKKYKAFYVGKKSTKKELEVALRNCYSANLVGKDSVSVAVSIGLAKRTDVGYIKRFPYIQIYHV